MNWEAIGAIGEIVSALAVAFTLIYLAIQIRQGRKTTRSQNIHAETEQYQRLMDMQLREELQEPLEKLSKTEKLNYREATHLEAHLLSSLSVHSALYRHHQEGLETAVSWKVMRRRLESIFLTPYARSWWQTAGRYVFEPDFVAEVDQLLTQLPHHADPTLRALAEQESNVDESDG